MYQSLAERRGPTTEIHLEDWFHPASQSVWITWLDDEVCDRLARCWRETASDADVSGASGCEDQVELYRLRLLPAQHVARRHACWRGGNGRNTNACRPTRSPRFVAPSRLRVWADVTRLVLELNRELARLRRRVSLSLATANR